jgi:hypothetical protein
MNVCKTARSVLAVVLASALLAACAPPPPPPQPAPPPPAKHKLDAKTQLETGRTY